MLHAEHLVVAHPISGKPLDLRAPLPKDFKAQLEQLRKLTAAEDKQAARAVKLEKKPKKTAPPAAHVREE
jgi:23S rRNA pseudouridine1911/1915/1917 synthase